MNFDNYRRILHLDLDAFFASVEQRVILRCKGRQFPSD